MMRDDVEKEDLVRGSWDVPKMGMLRQKIQCWQRKKDDSSNINIAKFRYHIESI